jgi:hypothetical protein
VDDVGAVGVEALAVELELEDADEPHAAAITAQPTRIATRENEPDLLWRRGSS